MMRCLLYIGRSRLLYMLRLARNVNLLLHLLLHLLLTLEFLLLRTRLRQCSCMCVGDWWVLRWPPLQLVLNPVRRQSVLHSLMGSLWRSFIEPLWKSFLRSLI